MVLEVIAGKIVSVRGVDPTEVGNELGVTPVGHPDLLVEADALATRHEIPDTQAVGAAKAVLQRRLRSWLVDPDHSLEVAEGPVESGGGPTISLTHALVELVLADQGQELSRAVLPDLEVLLRRSGGFLDLYAPLRLSEEADLIVAKITGQRTALEIAARSPHGRDEVIRLLAALVLTGMLEPVPVASSPEDSGMLQGRPESAGGSPRRRVPVKWLVAAAATLALVLSVATFVLLRGDGRGAPAIDPAASGTWTVVVDMGCEPQELQRVLQKANQHPKDLRAIRASLAGNDPCWRLVWGRFDSEDEAFTAIGKVPGGFIREGFTPHPARLDGDGGS